MGVILRMRRDESAMTREVEEPPINTTLSFNTEFDATIFGLRAER